MLRDVHLFPMSNDMPMRHKMPETWRPWFAWRPVRIDGRHVWGRWVERALFDEYHTGPMWRYRLPASRGSAGWAAVP
jgi:hypothetical protein